MIRAGVVVAAVVVAGCVPVPQGGGSATPAQASLSATELRLTLTDGATCVAAPAPSGRMPACGVGMGFAIRPQTRAALDAMPRAHVRPLIAAGTGTPLAEVVITDPAGIDHVFLSP